MSGRNRITRRGYLGRSSAALGTLTGVGGVLTAACEPLGASGSPPSSSRQPVTVSLLTNAIAGSQSSLYQDTLAEFQRRNPTITVDFQPKPGGMFDQLTALAAANSMPNVVLGAGNNSPLLRNLVNAKQLLDISAVIRKLRINLTDYVIPKGILDLDGKYYGMPFFQEVKTIYVNASMFEKAGVKLPAANWTWDDLVTTARAVTRPNESQWGIWIRWNRYDIGWLLFYLSNVADLKTVSPDGTQVFFDRPEAIEAVQFALDLLYRHGVSPTAEEQMTLAADGKSDVFQWGFGAMAIEGGSGPVPVAGRAALDGAVAHMPISPRTKKRFSSMSGQGHWVTSTAASMAEDATMLAAWLGGEFTSNLAIAKKTFIPPFKASLKRPEFVAPPPRGLEVIAETMTTYADAVPFILSTAATAALGEVHDRIFRREMAAAEGLKEMQRVVNATNAR